MLTIIVHSCFAQLKINSSGKVLICTTFYCQPSGGGIVRQEGAIAHPNTTTTLYIAGKTYCIQKKRFLFNNPFDIMR